MREISNTNHTNNILACFSPLKSFGTGGGNIGNKRQTRENLVDVSSPDFHICSSVTFPFVAEKKVCPPSILWGIAEACEVHAKVTICS